MKIFSQNLLQNAVASILLLLAIPQTTLAIIPLDDEVSVTKETKKGNETPPRPSPTPPSRLEQWRLGTLTSATETHNLAAEIEMGKYPDLGRREIVEFHRIALRRGDPDAARCLGNFYLKGEGVEKDPVQAAQYYRQASDGGNISATNDLGRLYSRGEGVKRDPKRAVALFLVAAKKGNITAMENLASCYKEGLGVPKNLAEGKKWAAMAKAEKEAREEEEDDFDFGDLL